MLVASLHPLLGGPLSFSFHRKLLLFVYGECRSLAHSLAARWLAGSLARSYDDSVIHELTLTRPDWDISPNDYIALQQQSTRMDVKCACNGLGPDCTAASSNACCNATNHLKCPAYTSTNFLLLGLVLAQATGAASWEGVDQKALALLGSGSGADGHTVASSSPLSYPFNATSFYKHGTCATYPSTVPYFDWCNGTHPGTYPCPAGFPTGPVPMANKSCLNGWAFGNAGSSALDAAHFMFELFAGGGGGDGIGGGGGGGDGGGVFNTNNSRSSNNSSNNSRSSTSSTSAGSTSTSKSSLLNDTTLAELRKYDGPLEGFGACPYCVQYGLGVWKTESLSLEESEINATFLPGIAPYLVYEGTSSLQQGCMM
jgi:hypothetical protein